MKTIKKYNKPQTITYNVDPVTLLNESLNVNVYQEEIGEDFIPLSKKSSSSLWDYDDQE